MVFAPWYALIYPVPAYLDFNRPSCLLKTCVIYWLRSVASVYCAVLDQKLRLTKDLFTNLLSGHVVELIRMSLCQKKRQRTPLLYYISNIFYYFCPNCIFDDIPIKCWIVGGKDLITWWQRINGFYRFYDKRSFFRLYSSHFQCKDREPRAEYISKSFFT